MALCVICNTHGEGGHFHHMDLEIIRTLTKDDVNFINECEPI